MKRLAKILFILTLLLFVSASCYARPKDIVGWQGARWGMSENDILRTFGSQLTKLPKRERFAGRHVDYVIKDFSLEGNVYTVFFQMDGQTDKLGQILIRLNEMETRTPRGDAFNHLALLLTARFDTPTEKSDQTFDETIINYRSMYLTRTWRFPTSTVELYYGWDNQIYASLLSIRYFPTKYPSRGRHRTTRWTGAAGACFASSSVRRRLR